MLTNKAKQDFEKWLEEGNHTPWTVFFDSLPDTVKNAYYIEWMDLHDLHVAITYNNHLQNFSIELCGKVRTDIHVFKTRNEATKAAILTANKIYNEQHNNH